ncbi:MAG: hypothetical protein OER88_10615, partial [Planctomycetota bacterium]|nr:hypothetical protein [Planctomycetota bacterium]
MKVLDAIRSHAEARPDHPALVSSDEVDRVVSYAELVAQMTEIAGELTRAGVGAGDRCGLRAQQGEIFVLHAL